jgi:hypothetical protein
MNERGRAANHMARGERAGEHLRVREKVRRRERETERAGGARQIER